MISREYELLKLLRISSNFKNLYFSSSCLLIKSKSVLVTVDVLQKSYFPNYHVKGLQHD